jgi:hypothetical protein
VLLDDGAGSFAGGPGGDVKMCSGLIGVALGDFDRDGRQDVASVKQSAGSSSAEIASGPQGNVPRQQGATGR